MNFSEKLKTLMQQQGLTQAQVKKLTGIGASSISQYVSGKNEPSNARKKEIAVALGVQENYFDTFLPEAKIQSGAVNLPVKIAAKLMGKSAEWVMQGLQQNIFPWGYAVKIAGSSKYSYFISSVKFTEYTGIPVPYNYVKNINNPEKR